MIITVNFVQNQLGRCLMRRCELMLAMFAHEFVFLIWWIGRRHWYIWDFSVQGGCWLWWQIRILDVQHAYCLLKTFRLRGRCFWILLLISDGSVLALEGIAQSLVICALWAGALGYWRSWWTLLLNFLEELFILQRIRNRLWINSKWLLWLLLQSFFQPNLRIAGHQTLGSWVDRPSFWRSLIWQIIWLWHIIPAALFGLHPPYEITFFVLWELLK